MFGGVCACVFFDLDKPIHVYVYLMCEGVMWGKYMQKYFGGAYVPVCYLSNDKPYMCVYV